MPIDPETVKAKNAILDELPGNQKLLFEQQSCAVGTSFSMPVVTSELINTALSPPPFDLPFMNTRTFVRNNVSNPVQAVPFYVLPSLQTIIIVTTVRPQGFIALITTNSSAATEIFPNLNCCTNIKPRVIEQPTVTSEASKILVVVNGKIGEANQLVVPFENTGIVFFATRLHERSKLPLQLLQFHVNKAR